MDKAVKEKVSEAVQNKLRKMLGSVDSKLHEYIMFMVVNGKTRTKLEDRLKPFLGEDSDRFALWLIKLLDEFKCYNRNISSKSEIKSIIEKESEPDILDVLMLNPQSYEVIELLSKDDLQCPLASNKIPEVISKRVSKEVHREISKKVFKEVHRELPEKTSKEVSKEVPMSHEYPTKKKKLPVSVEQYTDSQTHSEKKLKVHESETLRNHLTNNKVGFRRRNAKQRKLLNPSLSQATDSGEYDPLYPSVDDWHGPSRRKFSISSNSEANKLLFRAMDDANTSILGGKNPVPVYQPTPIKILAKDRENGRTNRKRGYNYNLHNEVETADCNSVWLERNEAKLQHYLPCSSRIESNLVINKENAVQQSEVSTSESTEVVKELVSISDEENDGTNDQEHRSLVTSPQSNLKLNRFVDTVEKTDSHTLCNKLLSEDSDMQDLPVLDKASQLQQALEDITPNKQKSVERCPLWPVCKNNDTCDYHHPSVSCKAFPNCNFLDKCLYVHPFCKFDSNCTRRGCPYTHVSKRDLSQTNSRFQIQPRNVKKPSLVTPQLCKFYPNCNVYHCSFLHPNKKCHFGPNCKTPNCPFLHQNFPSQGKFKWVAASSSSQ